MRAARIALPLLAGLLAAVAVWRATAAGPLYTPDGFSYIGAARSVVAHGTLRVPTNEWHFSDSTSALHQFPPAYPLVLAAALHVAPPLDAARLIDAAAAFTTVAGLSALVGSVGGLVAGVAMPLALFALRGVAIAHLAALSEPLFIVVLLAAMTGMALWPRRPLAYGLTAAIADLVRYAGASLVGAAALWAGWHAWHEPPRPGERGRLTRTLGAAATAGLPGLVGHLAWRWRVRRAGLAPVDDAPRWMGHVGATLAEGARTMMEHLAPVGIASPWRPLAASLVAAGAGVVVVRGWRASAMRADLVARRVMAACAVIACAYAAVIVYARLFVGDAIPFDDRILAPLLVCASVGVVIAGSVVWPHARRRAVAVFIAALWLVGGIAQTIGDAQDELVERQDYASPIWQHTPIADWLRGPGRRHALFTNDPVAIYVTVDRPSRNLPETLAADSVARFHAMLRAGDGAIVAYATDVGFGDSADPAALAEVLGMCPALRSPAGTVWTLRCDGSIVR